MYLNYFCLVLVLVSVSADFFDEELPLYLSDDILVYKLPSITKRSAPENSKTDVRDSATITSNNENAKPKNEDIKHTEKKKTDIEHQEESGLMFLPSFRRRTRRSISNLIEHPEEIVKREATEDKSEGQTSPKNKEEDHGSEIENKEESGLVFLPSFGRRSRRSIDKNDDKDLMSAENNIVFLPSFKRKGFRRFRRDVAGTEYRQIYKRSTKTINENEENKKKGSFFVTEQNEELSDSDTVNGEESGLVFLPSFGRRSRRSIDKNDDKDLMSAENNIVFLPSFKRKGFRRFRRDVAGTEYKQIYKRSTKTINENEDNKKKGSLFVTEQNEELSDSDTVNGEESGLVFLPSFGRRSRRNVVESSTSSSTDPNKEKSSDTEESKHDQVDIRPVISSQKSRRDLKGEGKEKTKTSNESNRDANDESVEESGLVFLPSFGRRSRRSVAEISSSLPVTGKTSTTSSHVNHAQERVGNRESPKKIKREVKDEHSEKKKTEVNDSNEDRNDESVEESGLVFLPSFGRRSRRSVAEISSSVPVTQKTSNAPHVGHAPKRIENVESSKKIKREVKDEHSEKKKTEVTDSNEDRNDESVEESGLVFLPSFGRRSRRSVIESSSPLPVTQKTTTTLPKDAKNNLHETQTQTTLLKTKREVTDENKQHKESKHKDFDEDRNDESEEESGLVFLPSFNRRSRRSLVENGPVLPTTQRASTSTLGDEKHHEQIKTQVHSQKTKREVESETSDQKKRNPNHTNDANDEVEEESGLVFLPSFGRRQRRDISSTVSSTKKEEKTTVSPAINNEKESQKSLDFQESGLVFLPTFNRRT